MKIKFFVEVSFPDIYDDRHVISVYSGLQSQCEAHGLLRTVAKQFSVNAKDLCHISVPDHVTFLNQVTYSGNLVQTELPIERKPNQITFG